MARAEQQLHGFAGTAAGRTTRFADVIEVAPPDRMPPPLIALMDAVVDIL